MHIKKEHWPVLIVTLVALLFFSVLFFTQGNYEFITYVGVIIFFLIVFVWSSQTVAYPTYVLWLLSIWAIFHMAGGALYWKGTLFYNIIFVDIVGSPYFILKYDQVIHIYGFFVATLLVYHLLEPLLKKDHRRWIILGFVVVMAGLGLGALNEIVEFITTLFNPNNGVGGYVNTSLDLVADIIGAVLAWIVIRIKK